MADGFSIPQFKYSHQTGAVATTQLKTGPGVLRTVVVNTCGGTPGVVTLADNAAATTTNPIAIITPVASSTVMPVTVEYDIAFQSGLTYTNAGGAGSDFTVTYI